MRRFVLFATCLMLSACAAGIGLAPPPNLYRSGTNYPEARVAQSLRTAQPRIFYMTDRAPQGDRYGSDRSQSMAFGAATVKFGRDLNWDELLRRTRADSDDNISTLWVPEVTELVRFESTPLPVERRDGRLGHRRDIRDIYDGQARKFQAEVAAEIARTGNSTVLVYLHGFNNDFDDSLTALANIWHFAGRESVPISFTWPAGNGIGPLGYFRDRDAGTFSVHHAKEFLRMLAQMPEVDQIDIVAHSRGTDVATTALRELIIEARGGNRHPKLALKTGTLIMAAPDLDVDIVRQRLQAERFAEAFEQVNLYINPDDGALRLSAYLTRSTRLGALKNSDFQPGELEILGKQSLVHFIRVENVRGGFGHAYFRDNPAVLSDVVLALRTRAFPGGTLRPLEQDEGGVWVLHPNYPLDRLPDLDIIERRAQARDER
ncbi:alpha/beta hydrolase [uncultured Tateyamaria sp.]|uniref:alpha/beta hydrolase n=1 Tax=uncultured Tateyamaria sp. TaxID=455651 RepID=UPI002612FCC8|nr:alpha/beta hydrolase [uncultured Tateyamaria sp.]